eukprot:1180254-Prorocentrum_minimum.AAC.7
MVAQRPGSGPSSAPKEAAGGWGGFDDFVRKAPRIDTAVHRDKTWRICAAHCGLLTFPSRLDPCHLSKWSDRNSFKNAETDPFRCRR